MSVEIIDLEDSYFEKSEKGKFCKKKIGKFPILPIIFGKFSIL